MTFKKGERYCAQIIVTNVTDEDYWQSVGGLPGYGYLNAGEPTALKVSATFDF